MNPSRYEMTYSLRKLRNPASDIERQKVKRKHQQLRRIEKKFLMSMSCQEVMDKSFDFKK